MSAKKQKTAKKNRFPGYLAAIVVIMSLYSLLPAAFLSRWPEAPKSENNQAAVSRLADNSGEYFSFIVFGDNHAGLLFNDSAAMKLIWHMNREDRFRKTPIDFVLSVGDVTLDGAEGHFKSYKKLQGLIKFPVVAAIGNHDNRELFEKYVGDEEFSFVDRNSYFIILDNEVGELSEDQFRWFEEELEKGREYDHIFVALHKPPFDVYQQDWYNMDNQPWAYRFRKLCAKYDVRMVFAGHRHMFKHEVFDGVDYIVTGGGGMLLEIPESEGGYHHYVRVLVNNDYVTFEVRKVSVPFWQFITYYMWKEALYWARNFYGIGYMFGKNTKIEPLRVKDLNNKEYWTQGIFS